MKWRWLIVTASLLVFTPSHAKPSLHELVREGDIAAIEQAISARRLNREDKRGNTPLHYAAAAARVDIAELLLANGAQVNAVNSRYGTTPLHDLARTVRRDRKAITETVELLLDAGGDHEIQDGHGESAFVAAARTGNRFVVQAILDRREVTEAQRSQSLALAREFGRLSVIRLLQERGVESSEGQEIGLLHAATIGDYAMTEALLHSGAAIETRDANGETPLMRSVSAGHAEIARLLIDSGASVSSEETGGRTALHYAAADGRADLVDLLLAKNADVNALSETHGTPLVSAAEQERVDMVTFLLQRGAEPADVDATPELAFGSGLAWQLYADFHEQESPPEVTASRRSRARQHFELASAGFERELDETRKLRKRKQRGEAVMDAVAVTIAVAATAAMERMYEEHKRANRRQLIQITALNDASSYADYHRRYDMYSQAMLKPQSSGSSMMRDTFHLDLGDNQVANKSSFPGLDVIISEYERRIALTEKLSN